MIPLSMLQSTSTVRAKEGIADIESALVQSNPQGLKKYLAELKVIRGDLEELLREGKASGASN